MKNNKKYDNLINILKEMFQHESSDLDFGIYRIMNKKSSEINNFLDKELPIQMELQINNLNGNSNIQDFKDSIYSHLLKFFARYYDEGDFISQQRFKENVYAIPYEGEEIKLHWANADQYYIKTSENFKDYVFNTKVGNVVFKLLEVSEENSNNKGDKKNYVLSPSIENKLEVIDENLVIYFEYIDVPKNSKQGVKNDEIINTLKNITHETNSLKNYLFLFEGTISEKSKMEKELDKYTAKNTFDYFIHKDLNSFLTRELDNYIKNEVIFLSDIDTVSFEKFIVEAKIIKEIGSKIITFLAQMENFQKKLWLKKKFIYKAEYCISLDRIPELFYKEIIENDEQVEEWKRIFKIEKFKDFSEELDIDFVKKHKNLLIDTKFFDFNFKFRLLSRLDNIEAEITGTLINSDNFHALNLLQKKYQGQIDVVYIDPPYNSPSSEILYKNNFKHSSWLSLMHSRLLLSKELLSNEGSHVIAIDKWEFNNLYHLVNDTFPENDNVSVSIQHNKKGTQGDHFSYSNEYAIFSIPFSKKNLNEKPRLETEWEYSNLRNWGSESDRNPNGNTFFPIYVQSEEIIGYGKAIYHEDNAEGENVVISSGSLRYYDMNENETEIESIDPDNPVIAVWPINNKGVEKKWRYEIGTITSIKDYIRAVKVKDNYKIEIAKKSDQFKTQWDEVKYNAGDYGTKLLTSMGFTKKDFQFSKSIYTVMDSIYAVGNSDSVVLDYFAGSGTTAPAVMELNRLYGGNRKFILVEMGNYFESVTKTRVLRSAFSFGNNPMDGWKNGIPTSEIGYSSFIQYFSLESFDDSLNNIQLEENEQLGFLNPSVQEEYKLKYMLDIESKDSDTFLNIKAFNNPFGYFIDISENNELKSQKINLVETFNYLIGLKIKKYLIDKELSPEFKLNPQGKMIAEIAEGDEYHFLVFDGIDSEGQNTLIIWRNITEDLIKDNVITEKLLNKYSIDLNLYDKIYINGDSYLTGDSTKVIQIDAVMKSHLFELEGI